MDKRSAIAFALAVFGGAPAALCCGAGTVALIERVRAMAEPLAYKCGREFNEMLARVHKGDWKGALAAYEAHLANLGKREAGSENALATLTFLREKADAR